MFESVAPDPGVRGLVRAAIIFYAIAVLTGLGLLLLVVTGSPRLTPVRVVVYLLFIALAVVTGRGIDNQPRWAKWVGSLHPPRQQGWIVRRLTCAVRHLPGANATSTTAALCPNRVGGGAYP